MDECKMDEFVDAEPILKHSGNRRRDMRRAMMVMAAFLALSMAEKTANAQEDKEKARGAITLTEVTITGRIEKPIAAVDVARIQPRLTLAELRQPFLDRIEQAIFKAPF
jgi:hypothetical protein